MRCQDEIRRATRRGRAIGLSPSRSPADFVLAPYARSAGCLAIGLAVYAIPRPEGVEPEGWRVFAIFVTVIAGFILRPYPMGPMVLFGVVAGAITGSLELGQALSGFGEKVVWLVVGAFLLSGAVRDTGLGRRAALLLVKKFGRSILGVAYAQAAAELLLGPLVPSNTARGGGILAPISDSLSRALGARPGDASNQAGAFLSLVGAHCNLITAAMFLTGMAANPLFAAAARDVYDVPFDDWSTWALAMIVPGLIALALLPLLLYKLIRPRNTDGRPAQELARRELEALGPLSRSEKILAAVFVLMIFLWSVKAWGPSLGLNIKLDTTLVTLLGVTVLLATGAQSWKRMIEDSAAWDTLIWLGGLLTMANALKDMGVVDAFATAASTWFDGSPMLITVIGLALVYFYSMYAFSMLTAHISAMATAFLLICLAAGAPGMLAAALFAAFSNLCACTTNYSSGPVIIYFGLGHVPTATWFRVGFLVSLFHLCVWIPAGLLWWHLLGWW